MPDIGLWEIKTKLVSIVINPMVIGKIFGRHKVQKINFMIAKPCDGQNF
jgi:hypothetical protein